VKNSNLQTLSDACLDPKRRPDQAVMDSLAQTQQRSPLSNLYSSVEFPADASVFKLGGHARELGHIHIDVKKTGGVWQLSGIWMCR